MTAHRVHPLAPLVAVALIASGCTSPDSHRKRADGAAARIVNESQQEALGRTEPFTIEEPADSLRRRLMISQELPGHVSGVTTNELFGSSEPLKVSLLDALQFAARSSREYQEEKEKVFSTALDLDLSRAAFRNSYSGLISALLSGSGGGDDATRGATGDADAGITRKLETGATLSSKLGLDLVRLLTMDKSSTFGVLADATVSIPLLRGAGRRIAREPLTQAERNVIYAIWDFERFKKTFALDVAGDYLRTLELEKQIQNAEANYRSIVATRERVEAMAQAGRTSQTEVDQAAQNELQASNGLVSLKQRLETQLDAFKVKLGIPVDARIELDSSDLAAVSDETMDTLSAKPTVSAADAEREAGEYVLTALSDRLDLIAVRYRYEDAKRAVKIAEDALDPDMKLELSGSTRRTTVSGGTDEGEVSFGDGLSYNAVLKLDLPWDKTEERAAFRKSVIALRKAERSIEAKEDSVKQELRGAARKIEELRETYFIQQKSVALAERRVESADLFLQAGKIKIRDLLEAQEDLVEARDKLISAVVSYHLATLQLRKDLELLQVDEKGLWRDDE